MHRGKIKRLSPSVVFPLAPSGTRFAIDYKLVAKFIYQECPHVVRLKETSRAALVYSPFSRLL